MTDMIARTLNRLSQQLRGRLSLPSDEGYAAATAIWAKPSGAAPRAVVHCRTPEDVQLAIRAARDCDLPLSVRGGGHDWAGRALCQGIVIDMRGMNHVVVDAANRVAQISGGACASDVAVAAEAFGAAAVTGSVGAVGMTGLTLGGGYGPLIGRCGLALDNLFGAEIVLADGRLVFAHSDNEEELFWALRGGGGNFGVVTRMHHRLHDLAGVRSGMLLFPFDEAGAVLGRCADIAALAPAELTFQLGFTFGPDGPPVLMIVPTWCGSPDDGEAALAPFLKIGTLLANTVAAISCSSALSMFDPYLAHGQRTFMETCWISELELSSIDAFTQAIETAISPGCAVFTHEFKGAASRVPAEATAFGLRHDHVLVEILATFADRSDKLDERRHRQWARSALESFEGLALPGGYPNLLADGDTDRASKSYGSNAERLVAAKRHYDPDNVFRSAIPLPVGPAMADVS